MPELTPATDPATGEVYLPITARGVGLLKSPLLNKGTAFTPSERATLGLDGLLPAHISTIDEQLVRAWGQYRVKETDLERHIYLADLQDSNETLFYRFVLRHLEELVPIIYTPTVAEACRHWSRIFRRSRGIYITPAHRGRIADVLHNRGGADVAVIVVTDNERILGIGDQGAGGMGIPIGKLALYTVGAGIHPGRTLPVSLDVGTNNEALLEDPLYLGWRHPRLQGDEYWELVDEFVTAVEHVFPNALLQWEDFANTTSFRHLERYRDRLPSFNDDIQGTAAMVVGGLIAAMRLTGEALNRQRVTLVGAGSAATGIVTQIAAAMATDGLDEAAARRNITVLDSRGLVLTDRPGLAGHKVGLATDPAELSDWDVAGDEPSLLEVVENFAPSVLIGVSGQSGAFGEDVVRAMAKSTSQPVIMPLSNPTENSEVHPADAIRWSEGRAIVASGSPFADVWHADVRHRIGQANNMFIFPGVGLGSIVSRAHRVTTGMFLAAADALAAAVDNDSLETGALYPPISRVREVSRNVAVAVARQADREGVGTAPPDLEHAVSRAMWRPEYLPYRAA